MRENNRKSIERCRKKLPQFTTMNVIDGQAGLVIYSSLIFYSLTIDNILNIIVLLILAAVTIATLTGDNGILSNASKAREETQKANAEEQVGIAVEGSIKTDGNIHYGNLKINLDKIPNITGVPDEIMDSSFPITVNVDGYDVTIKRDGSVILGEYIAPGNPDKTTGIFKEASTINGKEGNKNNPVIPEGFKPINEGNANWGDGTTEPPGINEGLVIQDGEGNQYVWIAVDGVVGRNGKTLQNAVEGEIILGRYLFETGGKINTTLSPSSLGGDLKLTSTDTTIYREMTEKFKNNAIAKDINGFIDSVEKNGGYYIARFEASEGNDGKADSKYNQVVWANISQTDAANACLDLYTSVESDLINSYAWDTAVLFIQKNSGDSDYSRQARLQNTLANTGKATNGSYYDLRCNIYDMAGNCREWTTESSSFMSGPSVTRGGEYLYGSNYTTSRGNNSETTEKPNFSFRSILYINNG